MNLPNKLTLLRILLIPVFVVLVSIDAIPGNYILAALVFIGASITDYLDGSIARKRDMVTDFGKFADPLADKILTTVAFIYMLVDGVCHPLVLVIIVVREFTVSGVRMVAAGAPGGKVIAANRLGKAKTVFQMVTIIAYYLLAGVQRLLPAEINLLYVGYIPQIIAWVLCWAVAVLTLVSGVQYVWQNRAYINTTR